MFFLNSEVICLLRREDMLLTYVISFPRLLHVFMGVVFIMLDTN